MAAILTELVCVVFHTREHLLMIAVVSVKRFTHNLSTYALAHTLSVFLFLSNAYTHSHTNARA